MFGLHQISEIISMDTLEERVRVCECVPVRVYVCVYGRVLVAIGAVRAGPYGELEGPALGQERTSIAAVVAAVVFEAGVREPRCPSPPSS